VREEILDGLPADGQVFVGVADGAR
jgi:hypothetical protein